MNKLQKRIERLEKELANFPEGYTGRTAYLHEMCIKAELQGIKFTQEEILKMMQEYDLKSPEALQFRKAIEKEIKGDVSQKATKAKGDKNDSI